MKGFLRMQMNPVAGDIDGHAQLEKESVLRVEETQGDHQTHCATAIGQLVQHGSKFSTCAIYTDQYNKFINLAF